MRRVELKLISSTLLTDYFTKIKAMLDLAVGMSVVYIVATVPSYETMTATLSFEDVRI